MMFLKSNKKLLLDKMDKNAENLSARTVSNHRAKINLLTGEMYPDFPPGKAFQKFERALGHNLFVKAIRAISKTGKNKTVFAKGILKAQ
jgi:hypothetical protein